MPDPASATDERLMRIALELATKGQGSVEPNPMVGCLLVRDGEIIGQGFHARFGGPHAEIAALKSLPHLDHARGATAYMTLEPCCHHGKTPPCSDALIAAGVDRVVVAMQDPHAQVDGGGLNQLREAGIAATVGVLQSDAEELNAPYLKRVRDRLPYVIAKWAMTIDGKISTVTGQSQWITGPQSRSRVHTLRGRVDAIVTGMGTIRADDPLLTARPRGPRTATRVVLCRSHLPDAHSRLMQSIDEAPITLIVSPTIDETGLKTLLECGADVLRCQSHDDAEMVMQTLRHLADSGATNVLLEAGGQLMGSFAAAGQIDECHVYLGAKIFGGVTAPGPIGGEGVLSIEQAMPLQLKAMDRFDDDVRLIYQQTSR